MTVDEIMIIKNAAKGDHAAFEQIVNLYEKKVYNIAFKYCNNVEDAMDISQEVFLRVYRFLPKFNGDSQFVMMLLAKKRELRKFRWKEKTRMTMIIKLMFLMKRFPLRSFLRKKNFKKQYEMV